MRTASRKEIPRHAVADGDLAARNDVSRGLWRRWRRGTEEAHDLLNAAVRRELPEVDAFDHGGAVGCLHSPGEANLPVVLIDVAGGDDLRAVGFDDLLGVHGVAPLPPSPAYRHPLPRAGEGYVDVRSESLFVLADGRALHGPVARAVFEHVVDDDFEAVLLIEGDVALLHCL